MTFILLLIITGILYLIFSKEAISAGQENKILEFIAGYNSPQAEEIYEAIEKHRKDFPVELLTALIYSES
ncbi:hypothetical protein KAV79_07490, partial [Candidatus Aerophobetes bacterium]|nr:hypothetical protein [Candidatus Aerophobetes bacterium]